MSISVFLKVFADINLYFACIGALPALFPYRFHFLWPALACTACAAVAAFLSDHGREKARFPFLLLAALPLLLATGLLELLILLPPVVYSAVLISRDQWSLEYFPYRDSFRRTLTILGLSVILVHFGVLIENRSDRTHVLSSIGMLRHVLIYAVCGILLQRRLRLGTDTADNRWFNTLQLTLLAAGTGVLVLGIVAAEGYLSSRGLSLGQLLGHLLQMLLGAFLFLFQSLFTRIAEMIKTAKSLQTQDSANSDIDPTPVMPMEEMQLLLEETSQEPAQFPWWLAVLLLIVFTVILILLLKTLRQPVGQQSPTETIVTIPPKAKESQPKRGSNRTRLRRIYRDFLRSEKRKGHKLLTFHTSRDILDELRPDGDPEAAARLRDLYLAARYDLVSPVTPEQVQQARDALRQYKQ